MKKTVSLLAAFVFCLSLAGCTSTSSSSTAPASSAAPSSVSVAPPQAESIQMNIAGLKGPTSMGMVQLMQQAQEGTAANDYNFTIAGSADEITPKLTQGELDIAAVPANLASVLYNNTEGAVQILAVNTLSVLYLVETGDSVQSLEDLKGKTIYATGKGSAPEYALNYILTQNGINPETDVTIEWKTEPTEVVQILAQTENAIAMLPQPYVTVAQTQVENLNVVIDINEQWEALNNGSLCITGVLVARTEFVQENPEQVAAFLNEYQASTEWVNANVAQAAQLVEQFDIVKAAVAEKAIPQCNITYLAGAEMKTAMQGYLQVLFDQNPKAVGGNLPDDAFYYAS